MKTIRLCSGCGTPLSADAPAELCPQCLLRSGIHTEIDSTGGAGTRIPIPGETFGPYRILRLLGYGGMGRVFEAEQITTGRRVALKVMGQALASEQDRKRFLREGRLAASVNHPHVVYIHGSEEIDGVPIIAMELVHGGTLKDRIKQGPLPIAEAVEAALEIIDGLEAANSAGVLHRDIKPANCFVASDGSVKVGDFGLSVSTLARGESLLTAAGSVMGTPAYASPEQLRGEELDVRSDIYSVGATLYHLLTGNTPFGATDFVKLITEVLDKEPANPRALRSEVPAELARLVLRCLAKDRKARFQTYAELRDALLPFRNTEITPAKPATRFFAAVIDDLIAYGPSMLFLAYWSYDPLDTFAQTRTLHAFLVWLPFILGYVLYYAIGEGLCGAAIGKTLLGLRLVDANRERPGIARAALRVFVYAVPFTLPAFLLMALKSSEEVRAAVRHGDTLITDWLWIPLTALLFITMRARNGYAALQDLASGTRVIVRPKTQQRPKLAVVENAPTLAAHAEAPRQFGPYQVTSTMWKTADAELVEAFDPVLRRKVWVHLAAPGTSLNGACREVSRAGRLRWIDGGQANGHAWNAYDALNGAPFLAIAQSPQPWSAVRFWLLDLAEEAAASAQNPETAATFALDHLWITANGRAVLLDFIAPGLMTNHAMTPNDCREPKAVQMFVASVAQIALEGKPNAADAKAGVISALVPLHARAFLASIARGSLDELRYVAGNLQSLIAKPAEVTRARRTAALLFVPAVAFVCAMLFAAIVTFERVRWDRVWAAYYPGAPSLRIAAEMYVDELNKIEADPDLKDLRLIATYLARHFKPVLTNQTFWATQPTLTLVPDMRRHVREAMEQHASTDAKIVAEAERSVSRRSAKVEKSQRLAIVRIGTLTLTVMLMLAAFIEFVSIVCFRVPAVLRLFGIATVTRDGSRATRARLLARWMVTRAPTIAMMLVINALVRSLTRSEPQFSTLADLTIAVNLACVFIAALIISARRPSAGIQDYITGTRIVSL